MEDPKNVLGFLLGYIGGWAMFSKRSVEEKYPGFLKSYELLTSLGCDEYLATTIFKSCIVLAEGTPLDKFLIQSSTLKKVEVALAIGLSGEDLSKLLVADGHLLSATNLPDDLGCSCDIERLY